MSASDIFGKGKDLPVLKKRAMRLSFAFERTNMGLLVSKARDKSFAHVRINLEAITE